MAWIQVEWDLRIPDPEEANAGESAYSDEPSLQFALVTAIAGIVRVHEYTTGNLIPAPGWPDGGIHPAPGDITGTVSSKNVPTLTNPFFGMAVRAVEQDNSGDNRQGDNQRFYDAIRIACQDTFDAGGTPTATTLWRAGNAQRPTNDAGDDDDFIGVSARVFPTFGADHAPLLAAEATLPAGWPFSGSQEPFALTFMSRPNTRYDLSGNVQLVTNDPTGPRLIGQLLETG